MSEFERKLNAFLEHYEALRASEGGDDSDDLFNKEFIVRNAFALGACLIHNWRFNSLSCLPPSQSLKTESMKYKEQNMFPAESGQLPVNKKKNRFKDILPCELL